MDSVVKNTYFLSFAIVLLCFQGIQLQGLSAQNSTDKILEVINLINYSYVDTVNQEQLSEAAIVAMLEKLDPHSVYIPKKEVQQMNESLLGNYEGIGIQFDIYKDTVLVVSCVSGGPSDKLGIQSGDRIIYADNKPLSGVGMTDDKLISLLKGKKGSQVKVSIKRRKVNHLIDYLITRDQIPIFSVDVAFMINDETGYLKINRFSKTTVDEFTAALEKLQKEGMKHLILDLKGNGGGYLYSAVEVADEFLDGKEVIVSTRGRSQKDQLYKARPKGKFYNGHLVVLIDEGSASASEILAGAIQDWDRGILIGRRSFGKGLVMKPYSLSDGSMIRLTTSRYYTPSGRCIQKEYDDDVKEYNEEILHRYKNGELYSADSINISKELRYKTTKGRLVYGGGGILPDIFFPADTLLLGHRYQDILSNGSVVEFSLDFAEKNRTVLSSQYRNELEMLLDDSLQHTIFSEFSTYFTRLNSSNKPIDKVFENHVSTQISAFLARYIWGSESYYKVLTYKQPIINKAVMVIKDWDLNWLELSQQSN